MTLHLRFTPPAGIESEIWIGKPLEKRWVPRSEGRRASVTRAVGPIYTAVGPWIFLDHRGSFIVVPCSSLTATNQITYTHTFTFTLFAHYAQRRMRVRQCPPELHWRAVG
jgi:hypothetical protein